MADRFHISPVADGIPFDNDTNGFTADNVQDAIEEVQSGATGKLMDFIFVANGNVGDKWLGFGNGSTSSDEIPLIVPQDGHILWATFSNTDDDVDTDIEFYKNGTLLTTWLVRNKRTAWKTDFSSLAVSQGDRISCFLKKYTGGTGDSTAQDPIIELFIQVNGTLASEGGTQHGV